MIFFALLLVLILFFYWRYAIIEASVAHFHGPPTVPFLGNSLIYFGKKLDEILMIMQDNVARYGLISRFSFGSKIKIIICDPKDIEVLLIDQKLMKKTEEYEIVGDYMGKGLITASPEKWHSQRKIANQGFQFRCLQEFVKIFEKNSEILVTKMKKIAGQTVDVFQLAKSLAFDNICETTMGTEVNSQLTDCLYLEAAEEVVNIFTQRFFSFFLQNNFFFKLSSLYKKQQKNLKILHEFADKVIAQRREELEEKMKEGKAVKPTALIDVLLTSNLDGKSLTNQEIRDEVDTFMAAGHGTTTSAITFCLFALAKHPEVQQKAFEEIQSSLGDVEGEITMADLNKLNYLDLVIKETLRLYPSVPFIGRKFLEDSTLNGKFIPKGSDAIILPFTMGRCEKVWENAEKFIPERFEPQNMKGKTFCCYFTAFGAGPRDCIGKKFALLVIKSVLVKVLKNFELFDDGFEPKICPELAINSSNGVKLRIKNRQQCENSSKINLNFGL